ncbi:MAG: hypothetical protein HKN70_02600, partial [Gammaproteobacteria bacterium]|nr:hypothetical protein [Gammaproteobacteria bacterium]
PMIADLVLRSANTFRSRCVGVLGALLMCAAVGLNELFYRGLLPATADIAVALCIVLFGYWVRHRWIAYIGVFTAACLLLQNLGDFFRWFNFNNWVLLSLLGASSIVLASLLDRYGAALKLKLDKLRQRHPVRSV